MTAAELDELERLVATAQPGEWDSAHGPGDADSMVTTLDGQGLAHCGRHNAYLIAAAHNALPALIAKVRAADALATRVDRALYDFGDDYPGRLDPVSDALDAYRKVQP